MKYIALLLLVVSSSVYAGGWTNAATPTRIDIVRGQGIMVFGSFGNGASCTATDSVFIQITHPQYNQVYSEILAAFASGKKIQLYANICAPMGWYSVDSVTYNTVVDGAVNIMN